MPRKKIVKAAPKYPEGWTVREELVWNGRHIVPGTELSFTAVRGRYKFVKYVETASACWVDVIGKGRFRAFHPERIKTVHRLKKLRPTG